MKSTLIYFCFIVIVTNINTLAKSITSEANYDVEEFINKLLVSRKFDELAEKLVDKAVDKIRTLEPLTQTKTAKAEHNQEDEPHTNVYKSILKVGKETNERLFKIDPTVLLQDSSIHPEDLQLNYKYLTRGVHEKKDDTDTLKKGSDEELVMEPDSRKDIEDKKQAIAGDDAEHHGEVGEEHEDKHSIEANVDSRKAKYSLKDYDKKIEDERAKELGNLQMQQQEKAKKLRNMDRAVLENAAPKFRTTDSEEDVPNESEETNREENTERSIQASIEEADDQNGEASQPETIDGTQVDASVKKPDNTYNPNDVADYDVNKKNEIIANEIIDYLGKKYISKTFTEATTTRIPNKKNKNDKIFAEIRDHSEKIETTTIANHKEVRVEGDRVYTFVENPEYAEYHEQAAKEKATTKSPEDFLKI